MCTVVALKGVRDDHRLVVAANRDEMYARPATGPRVVREAGPRVVAGLDEESGGTWMGANDAGLFAAITNQRQLDGQDRTLASRGHIVMDALAEASVEAAAETLRALDGRRYNGFNLMFGDASDLRVAYGRRERAEVAVEALDDGVWVLPNDRIGAPGFPKTARARALVAPRVEAPWPTLLEGLTRTLADHEIPPPDAIAPPPPGAPLSRALLRQLQALCIHTPGYGTRSATVLALSFGRVDRYLFADGPPCRAPLEDVTELLRAA